MKIQLSESQHQFFVMKNKKIYKVCLTIEEAKEELRKWN